MDLIITAMVQSSVDQLYLGTIHWDFRQNEFSQVAICMFFLRAIKCAESDSGVKK